MGDNSLTSELVPGYDNTDHLWSGDATMNAGTTYHFSIHPMHSDSSIYGNGGVGGTLFEVTPNVTESYTFIFNYINSGISFHSKHRSINKIAIMIKSSFRLDKNYF